VSKILIAPKDWPEIDHPSCQSCGVEMWLIRIAPHSVNREARTYCCPACDCFASDGALAAGIANRADPSGAAARPMSDNDLIR